MSTVALSPQFRNWWAQLITTPFKMLTEIWGKITLFSWSYFNPFMSIIETFLDHLVRLIAINKWIQSGLHVIITVQFSSFFSCIRHKRSRQICRIMFVFISPVKMFITNRRIKNWFDDLHLKCNVMFFHLANETINQ